MREKLRENLRESFESARIKSRNTLISLGYGKYTPKLRENSGKNPEQIIHPLLSSPRNRL